MTDFEPKRTAAVAMTVTQRPEYLTEVLDSWEAAMIDKKPAFYFGLEPTIKVQENIALITSWYQRANPIHCEIVVNNYVLGISKNPHATFGRAFDRGHPYVILAEDDLVVSDDILDYHRWACNQYLLDTEVAGILSFTHDELDEAAVHRTPGFGPWIWGTWADRWAEYVGKEWDVNQEFYTDHPGNEVGWDYHLNKRIVPRLGKVFIAPEASRSNSIGIYGAHSFPGVHVTAEYFKSHREPQEYYERVMLKT